MDGQPKKKESIKYCARKCHNGGPLTKMMANHRKKFWERTIAILSCWADIAQLSKAFQPRKGQLRQSRPSKSTSSLLPSRIYVKHFINLGAPIHIMQSPTILKLLLTAMTLVSVASEEGKTVFSTYFEIPK